MLQTAKTYRLSGNFPESQRGTDPSATILKIPRTVLSGVNVMSIPSSLVSHSISPARIARVDAQGWPVVSLCGVEITLTHALGALARIISRPRCPDLPPLAVVSANLDHLYHFGTGSRFHGVTQASTQRGDLEWLTLLDGAPLVTKAARLTGMEWPRLAGSDLTLPIIAAAAATNLRVGFLGGAPETADALRSILSQRFPELQVAGLWCPERDDLATTERSLALADAVREAGADLLFVGLGKPRQELWIAQYGPATGSRVMLAFGAAGDFIAGKVRRAPEWMIRAHAEWAFRLSQEPRRLAGRYLVRGPFDYLHLRSDHGTASAPTPTQIERWSRCAQSALSTTNG